MIWIEDATGDFTQERKDNLTLTRPLCYEIVDGDLWMLTNEPDWVKIDKKQFPMTYQATEECGGMMRFDSDPKGWDYFTFNIDKLALNYGKEK